MEKVSEQPQEQPKVVKPRRNRKFHKEIVSETATDLTLRVKHTPYKGEKISDTIRRDKKFNPKQRFSDLNGRTL